MFNGVALVIHIKDLWCRKPQQRNRGQCSPAIEGGPDGKLIEGVPPQGLEPLAGVASDDIPCPGFGTEARKIWMISPSLEK